MLTTQDLSRFIPQKVNTIKNFTIGKKVGKSMVTTQLPSKSAPSIVVKKPKK